MDILLQTDVDLNENLLKRYILEKAIENGSELKDVNFDGSNISTLIAALNYVFSVLSIKTELIYNEITDNSTLDTTISSKMKMFNFQPNRDVPAKILIELRQNDESVAESEIVEFNQGDVIQIKTENYTFNHIFDTDTIIDTQATKFVFFEGEKVELSYFLTNNTNIVVIKGYKWDIADGTLIVKNSNGVEIPLLKNDDDDITANEKFINDNFYMIDYTDENNLILNFSDGVLGENVTGEIFVEFYTTKSTEANNISQLEFELINQSSLEIVVTENLTSTYGGLTHLTIERIKSIMGKFYQSQNRIVTESDLSVNIETLFPGWNYKILDANEIPISTMKPGYVFYSLFKKLSNGDIEKMNYTEYETQINQIKNKIKMGIIPQNIDLYFNYISLEYDLVLNENIVNDKYNVISKIETLLISKLNSEYIFDNDIYYLNTKLVQMFVLQENINGLVDFNVKKLGFKYEITDFESETAILFKNYSNTINPTTIFVNNEFYFNYVLNETIDLEITNDLLEIAVIGTTYQIRSNNKIQYEGETIFPSGTVFIEFEIINLDLTNENYMSGELFNITGLSVDETYEYELNECNINYNIGDSNISLKKYEPNVYLNKSNITDNTDLISL